MKNGHGEYPEDKTMTNDQKRGTLYSLEASWRSGTGPLIIAQRSLSPPQRLSAFTLTETLVTISIIAILIALLLPALARARDLALQIECASNLRQIGVALEEYSNENRGHYPLTCAFTYG